MKHKTYKAAIFDMDGTVLNTLEDLTSALNHVLAETGHDHAYGTAQVRQFFGSGVQVAITRALAIEKGIASYEQLECVGQDGDTITPHVDAQEVRRIQASSVPTMPPTAPSRRENTPASASFSASSGPMASKRPSSLINPTRPYRN